MSKMDVKHAFEDQTASLELREFVALCRTDGPNQNDLDRLAMQLGPALGLSAAALAITAASKAPALGTAPAHVTLTAAPFAAAKLSLFGKLLASNLGKLAALGVSAGIGIGVFAYVYEPGDTRPQPVAQATAQAAPALPKPALPPKATPNPSTPAALSERQSEVLTATATPDLPQRKTVPSKAPRTHISQKPLEKAAPVEPAAPAPDEAPPPSELTLMKKAQAARQQPNDALALLATHERLYPRGALAQEREVLAIELLLKVGKTLEGKERAARFSASFPDSLHRARLRTLLAQHGVL